MVYKVVSVYNREPPSSLADNVDRDIPAGPLYPKVLDVIDKCDIRPATSKCANDMSFYGVTGDKIRTWLKIAVATNGYIKSVWCRMSPNRDCIAACDAYKVEVEELNIQTDEFEVVTMYLKFFISKTGSTIMQVSAHPSIFNS